MRIRGVVLLAVPLLLAACAAGDKQAASTSESPPSSSSSAPDPSTSAAAQSGLELAVEICTSGLSGADTLVSDAAHAARDGTRSVSEIADSFRSAQNSIEALATKAEDSNFPHLAGVLQEYADTLGRARVAGDVGLGQITDAREAVNIACYSPDAAPSS